MIDYNNNIQLSENKWNNFLIKIINEKIYININYKEPIIISLPKNNINNENKNNLIDNNENIIKDKKQNFFIKLSFYKKFCGFVCPIIISNSDFSTSENLMKNKIEIINEKINNNKNDNYKKIFKYCDNLIIQLKNEDFKIETISKKKRLKRNYSLTSIKQKNKIKRQKSYNFINKKFNINVGNQRNNSSNLLILKKILKKEVILKNYILKNGYHLIIYKIIFL